MTRLLRTLPWLTATTAVLLASGCSPDSAPAPDASVKKVISACQAVSGDDATIAIGRGTLLANRMAGEGQIRSICAYKDDKNMTIALVTLEKSDKDPAGVLAEDAASDKKLFSGNIQQPKFHPADGFVPGSFYADISPRFNAYEVEMRTFEGGYKLTIVINDPKDFATGEAQAVVLAHKVYENIQNGTAFTTI